MVNQDEQLRPLPREWTDALTGNTKRIVIVGGGIAGLRTAEALRELGFEGPLLGITAEHLPPYDRSALSTVALSDPDWHGESTPSSVKGFWWYLGHTAVDLDLAGRQVEVDDGRRIDFDGLVIATGRRARKLTPAPETLRLRTMADALRLRSVLHSGRGHLVVVGGGLTGVQVAATARTLGWEVTVADSSPAPLAERIGTTAAEWVWHRHRDHDVSLRLGRPVVAVRPGEPQHVEFADGSTIDADLVLTCVGTVPNTRWLERVGLDMSNGVRTDDRQQVLADTGQTVEGIVAVGEVATQRVTLPDGRTIDWNDWDNTELRGTRAAAALLGQRPPSLATPTFSIRLYEHEVRVVGLPHGTESGAEHRSPGFVVRYQDDGALVGAVAVDMPDDVPELDGGFLRP